MHVNSDKGLNYFEEHVVSTFFNRVDALLTAILQVSEKNPFFKPGQVYMDTIFETFSLHTVMAQMLPSLSRCNNPYCFTKE